MRGLFTFGTLAAALAVAGCAANPADNVPRADTSAPQTVTPSSSAESGSSASATSTTVAAADTVAAGSLAILPDSSKIEFVGSKVTGSHKGGFKSFRGSASLTADRSALAKLAVEIDMASTWADDDRLAGHLKAPDFFDVARFPKSTFETTAIKPGGDKGATHTVTGNLTLHGVTKSITFPATVNVTDGGMTLASEFSLNRKDFGIVYPGKSDDLIRDEVVIKLDVKAPKTG